jgi:hypothetical protein
MNEPLHPENRRARRAVRRLLDAVDRAVAAAREIEAARAALAREAQRTPRLRAIPGPKESEDVDVG